MDLRAATPWPGTDLLGVIAAYGIVVGKALLILLRCPKKTDRLHPQTWPSTENPTIGTS